VAPDPVRIAVVIGVSLLGEAPGRAAGVPLSISVSGNHFVNGAGQTIRPLGVNHASFEYGCVDGFGYNDGHMDDADAAAIASWGANAVRVPLNEDCWLGINGQPNSSEGADPPLTQAGYKQAVKDYVSFLNAHGLYAILDLHWTAPGSQVPEEQQPMPDADHSPGFWQSVASTFKGNPAVVFDVFNEPFDPTDPRSGDDQDPQDAVTWNCWDTGTKNGPAGGDPCDTSAYDVNGVKTTRYQVAGLQTLVTTIRGTGATQPVLTGGLDFANDLSQWATHAPDDPLNQEAASFHNYQGKS
jgi:aryl-phospho-beta-D-glucosidase BglC (GH1 family)